MHLFVIWQRVNKTPIIPADQLVDLVEFEHEESVSFMMWILSTHGSTSEVTQLRGKTAVGCHYICTCILYSILDTNETNHEAATSDNTKQEPFIIAAFTTTSTSQPPFQTTLSLLP